MGILIIRTSVGVQNFEPLQRVNKFQYITLLKLNKKKWQESRFLPYFLKYSCRTSKAAVQILL